MSHASNVSRSRTGVPPPHTGAAGAVFASLSVDSMGLRVESAHFEGSSLQPGVTFAVHPLSPTPSAKAMTNESNPARIASHQATDAPVASPVRRHAFDAR